jgi:TRAP-type C4-dicarboxylate transport system permease small subunit
VTPPKDDAAPEPADVPPTRKHEAATEPPTEPPTRESHLSLDSIPVGHPDDGPLSANVRKVDGYLGLIEQGLLLALLAIVVSVAALAAIHDKLTTDHLGRWWHTIVRGGTFTIAMVAAAFATQQQRLLAMDLISRRLTPRGRLILGIALKLLTIGITALLFYSGLAQRDVARALGGGEELSLFGLTINDVDVVTSISIGAALIIVHSLLHLTIDIEYLVRGKLPPERARSGH